MKIDNITLLCSELNEHAVLSFRDPASLNPYIARAIIGLDANEIVPRFYGVGDVSGNKFYSQTVERREIVIRIALNPNFNQGQSYSGLRDNLYRSIASSRSGRIELRFNQGDGTVAAMKGFITKLESPHFNETQEVQITIKCERAELRALERISIDVGLLTPESPAISDPLSTSPHGFIFKATFNAPSLSFVISDALLDPDWNFTITPGVIGSDTGFIVGDELYFSSEFDNKYLYIIRAENTHFLADKVDSGSIWPIIFPSNNQFYVTNVVDWNSIEHYPTYWGV